MDIKTILKENTHYGHFIVTALLTFLFSYVHISPERAVFGGSSENDALSPLRSMAPPQIREPPGGLRIWKEG